MRYLTAVDVAGRWSCSAGYVRKLARRGDLPGLRLGSDWRFSLAAVEAYERRHTSAPAEPIAAPAPTTVQRAQEVTNTTSVDGFALPADYAPVFPDLWPGHAPQAKEKRPSTAIKGR